MLGSGLHNYRRKKYSKKIFLTNEIINEKAVCKIAKAVISQSAQDLFLDLSRKANLHTEAPFINSVTFAESLCTFPCTL